MELSQTLYIKDSDHTRISALLDSAPPEVRDLLQYELERAKVISEAEFPADVVAMHSTVRFMDLNSRATSKITLVYPHEANAEEDRISILAPIGAALIGLRVGQTIKWPFPQGKEKAIEVVEVLKDSIYIGM
jgi:regulator of nucleoside diphosphate kinase